MSDTHGIYNQYINRMNKKHSTPLNSQLKTLEKKIKLKQSKQIKDKITQLSIDLHTYKNTNKSTSINKNFTYRFLDHKNNNLCDLRQQVQQLRMENQSLRQEIKIFKNNQNQLKYHIQKLQVEINIQYQLKNTIEKQYQKLQQKLKKYSDKIKQLFQNLINQKKKNAGLDSPNICKVHMVISPSHMSISNSLNLRKFQQQGQRDFLNSATRMPKKQPQQYLKLNNNSQVNRAMIDSFENSPNHNRGRGIIGMPQTFGTRY